MADTWLTTVTFSSVSFTGTASGLAPGSDTNPNLAIVAQYAFVAVDTILFGGTQESIFPAIQMTLSVDASGNLKSWEEHGFAAFTGGLIGFTANSGASFGSAGSTAFAAGGTLAITKDEAGSQWSYAGPGHSSSFAWSGLGVSTVVPGEMAPYHVALGDTATFLADFSTVYTTLQTQITNFFGQQNGTPIKGATLATGDRGAWESRADPLTPWIFTRSAFNVTVTDTDDGSSIGARIVTAFDGVHVTGGSASGGRFWDQTVYLAGHDPAAANVDMTTAREHGPLFVALVYPGAADTVRGRDSYDNGGTWQEGTIYTSGGTTNRSPSIWWAVGRIYVAWNRGPDVVQANSNDLGAAWSSPVTIVTGTNPRTVYDPRHGLTYYFYVSATNLLLKRSANFGVDFIDAAPLSVALGIGSQTVAAEIGSDGTVVVGYILAGVWTQVRSRDMGVSWA